MLPLETRKRSSDEIILIWLSGGTCLGVLPFVFFRIIKEDWLVAAFDISLVLSMLILSIYVYRTGKIKIAGIIIASLLILGMLTTVILKGGSQFVWAYPATISIYYLINYKPAALINIISILVLAIISFSKIDLIIFSSSMVTLIATNVFAYIFASRTSEQQHQLKMQATTDPLTKVGNRRSFNSEIKRLVSMQSRVNSPVSIISIDLDYFKKVNDTFGHAKGDEVLIQFTKILSLRLRGSENIYRIGGEEFVILPVNGNIKQAEKLAEQLRVLISVSELIIGHPITISLGVAQYAQGETEAEWLQRVDKALYQAKNSGRNQIYCID